MVADNFCTSVVDLSRQRTRLLVSIKEPAIAGMRQQRGDNAVLVHLLQGSGGRPVPVWATREGRCLEMMMHVDAARISTANLARGLREQSARRQESHSGGRNSFQKLTTGAGVLVNGPVLHSHRFSLLDP